jgi:hypothetical protein
MCCLSYFSSAPLSVSSWAGGLLLKDAMVESRIRLQ